MTKSKILLRIFENNKPLQKVIQLAFLQELDFSTCSKYFDSVTVFWHRTTLNARSKIPLCELSPNFSNDQLKPPTIYFMRANSIFDLFLLYHYKMSPNLPKQIKLHEPMSPEVELFWWNHNRKRFLFQCKHEKDKPDPILSKQ